MSRRTLFMVWTAITALSTLLTAGKAAGLVAFSWLELVGFISGLVSVWLVVVDSHWNWPIGNLNSAAFLLLFLDDRLFANAGLQLVFIVLGFWGWYMWLRKIPAGGQRVVGYAPRRVLIMSLVVIVACLYPLQRFLQTIDGAAPFWDTLTTVMSIVATYLLGKKYLQNWYLWITVDVIYVVLLWSRGLVLTAALYGILLVMATSGLIEWRRIVRAPESTMPQLQEVYDV